MTFKKILVLLTTAVVVIVCAAASLLSGLDFNRYKPEIEKIIKEATGQTVLISGDITFRVFPSFCVIAHDVSVQNRTGASTSNLLHANHLEIEVSFFPLLRGAVKIKRAILMGADIYVEKKYDGINLEAKRSQGSNHSRSSGKSRFTVLAVGNLEIRKSVIHLKDQRGNKTYNAEIDLFSLSARDFYSPIKTSLKAVLNGQPVRLSGTIGSFSTLADPVKKTPVELELAIDGSLVSVRGEISDVLRFKGFNLSLKLHSKSLKEIMSPLGLENSFQPKPISLSMDISDSGEQTYVIRNLQLARGNSDLEGNAKVNIEHSKPRIYANLFSKNLNINDFLLSNGNGGKKIAGYRRKIFSSDPITCSFLKTLDGQLNYRCRRLRVKNLVFRNLSIKALQKNGKLTIDSPEATLCGGNLKSSVTLVEKRLVPAVSVRCKLVGVNIVQLERALGCNQIIEGKANLDMHVTGKGNSVAEIMGRLSGKIILIMEKGKLNLKYVNLLGGDLALSTLRLLSPEAKSRRYTDINCFVGRFDIRNGKAYATALVCDTAEMTVIGEGLVDLRKETIDITLKPSPKKGLVGVTLSLDELIKPFKLGGTLAHPSLVVDPAKTAVVIGETLGGVILFGPVGIATALLGTEENQKNICPLAINAAKKGLKVSKKRRRPSPPTLVKSADRRLEATMHSIGKMFKAIIGH